MSAAPAFRPAQPVHIPGGWFHCPNAIADNLSKLTPAEAYLAIVAFQQGRNGEAAPVSDEVWQRSTGMTDQSRRNAEKGLVQHRLLDKSGRRYDVRGFIGWARHARPEEKRTVGRAPSKPAPYRFHPECESACAMASGRASLISVGSEEKTKPVLPAVTPVTPVGGVQRGADPVQKPTSSPGSPPFSGEGVTGSPSPHDVEQKWTKTLAAMRAGFSSAGVDLLMRLLTVLFSLADLRGVSDYVLAAAVERSYKENRHRMTGPGLLVKTVPEILRGWRAHGHRLDAPSAEAARSAEIALPVQYASEPEDSLQPSVWMRVRLELKARIPEGDYLNWLRRVEFSSRDGDDVVVFVPDAVTAEWIREEYRTLISEISKQLGLGVSRFHFRVPA